MEKQLVVNIINMAYIMFFDDSDTEDEADTIVEKINNYAETTVPNFNDKQFIMNFRMSPATFEDLLSKMHSVKEHNLNKPCRGHPALSLEKSTMILIWCLGNMESFRSVAERFGISKSTCWSVLYRTCHLVLKVNKKFSVICWPTGERAINVIREFSVRKIPGIIGAIDGSHIRIVAPKENHNSYVNRKSYHSVLLQGVCDSKMLFTDVYAGEAGSIHDYTLFKRSDLYRRIRNQEISFPDDSHLIGDLAYKLSETMIVGFKNYGNLSIIQKNFNFLLSQSRAVVENTFALLKGRFRRLKYVETVRLDLVSLLIVTACILHNICILKGDTLESEINLEQEREEDQANNPTYANNIEEEIEAANAVRKRNNIANALPLVLNRRQL